MALTATLGSSGAEQEDEEERRIRREHMFDKVVTPSDVGKLNRLVVPKHFAERHFLPRMLGDGPVLRFEDGCGGGKAWEFRFSYWGSSQSYVMTKGWSAFVRDRRLAAGDTVSFYRAGASLFIDCRRRGTGVVASVPATRVVVPAAVPQVFTLTPQQATADDTRTSRGRCLRLFGVDLEHSGTQPTLLDLQLALMRR